MSATIDWRPRVAALGILLVLAGTAGADIGVGPWTFDDLAFADDATQIGAGSLQLYCGATDLDDALTGYSPDRQIVNIGDAGHANHFQLDFLDLQAVNAAGPDLVFFETRYSSDPYEIALRPAGGEFTAFRPYGAQAFIFTGETGCSSIWGLEVEFDDYGFAAGTVVDAMQFRALANGTGLIEGDPLMAAVLNTGGTPVAASSWSLVKSLYR